VEVTITTVAITAAMMADTTATSALAAPTAEASAARAGMATRTIDDLLRVLLLSVIAMVVATGCAHFTPSLSRDASPSGGRAYVYGRFTIEAEPYALSDNNATMGFTIGCDDGQSYTIRFTRHPFVQLISIAPANCAMTDIVFSDAGGTIVGRRLPPPGWRQPRRFAAGQAYYLGDYEAATTHEWKVIATELRWALTSEENDYAGTTRDLFAAYRAFAGTPTVDRGFVSAPPKGKPRKRPADVPSPSPQQVARAAPLIDRTFPAMAACEADCASGDCMAFRKDGETAMTCIVYCKGDGDCPSGFSCNGADQGVESPRRTEEADAPLTGICVRAAATSTDAPSDDARE
jgi:hypothetical protein